MLYRFLHVHFEPKLVLYLREIYMTELFQFPVNTNRLRLYYI